MHTDPMVKQDALYFFEAFDSNPNGDPDNAGKPRVDLDSGHGLVSDVSLKRKIRDAVQFQVDNEIKSKERNQIFIRRGVSLNEQLEAAYRAQGLTVGEKTDADSVAKGRSYMVENYFDVRMFGAVMSTGKASAGKVTGPVTVGIGRSLDPVLPIDLAITRTASTKEEDKNNASQMGNKSVVPYGLYLARAHYQPTKGNQVTVEDLELLWGTMVNMFELTRSAARPDISVRALYVFTHDSALGAASARSLFQRVKVAKREGVEIPATSEDYVFVEPVIADLPSGVDMRRLV